MSTITINQLPDSVQLDVNDFIPVYNAEGVVDHFTYKARIGDILALKNGVQSVNGKTGSTITLIADDISDGSSNKKFVTQGEKNKIAFLKNDLGGLVYLSGDGTYRTVIGGGGGDTSGLLSATTFQTYTGVTAPATYALKSRFNTFTGTTAPATYQSKASIVVLTGTTLSLTYQSKASIVTLTGTTLPLIYQSKASIVALTGTTLPATYASKTVFNTFTGSTNTRFNTIEGLYVTGATNGLRKLANKRIALGGSLTGNTTISGLTGSRLSFAGWPVQYASDLSANYGARSIVDKGYITGNTVLNRAWVVYDNTNQKITVNGVNTSSANYTFQINDSSSNYIARFRNDKVTEFGGSTSQITFSASTGGNGIQFPTNQSIGFYEIDSASNVFRRITTATGGTGQKETHFKTFVIDQLSNDAPQVIKQYQTNGYVSATNSGVTTISSISMPLSGGCMMTVKADFIVLASDGHGGGCEVVSTLRHVGGTVSYVGSAIVSTYRRSTGSWTVGILADNTNKTANLRFINDTASAKSYKVTVNVTYTIVAL